MGCPYDNTSLPRNRNALVRRECMVMGQLPRNYRSMPVRARIRRPELEGVEAYVFRHSPRSFSPKPSTGIHAKFGISVPGRYECFTPDVPAALESAAAGDGSPGLAGPSARMHRHPCQPSPRRSALFARRCWRAARRSKRKPGREDLVRDRLVANIADVTIRPPDRTELPSGSIGCSPLMTRPTPHRT
ncbi:MAG: hypothetical protein JWM95_1214 [Gemmatimonadetes bacterium]|nr:hypothetical protein [Gemmatimonadota bacterium]